MYRQSLVKTITFINLTLYFLGQNQTTFSTCIFRILSEKDKLHVYILEIETNDGNKKRVVTKETSVAKYFDEKGTLVTKAFHTDLFKYFGEFNNEEKKTK